MARLKKRTRPRRAKENPSYKRNRLKRVWSKLVDLLGDNDEDLLTLRDFLDDLVNGYAEADVFSETGDPRKNGKNSVVEIF